MIEILLGVILLPLAAVAATFTICFAFGVVIAILKGIFGGAKNAKRNKTK